MQTCKNGQVCMPGCIRLQAKLPAEPVREHDQWRGVVSGMWHSCSECWILQSFWSPCGIQDTRAARIDRYTLLMH